jgi:hypothetical protein
VHISCARSINASEECVGKTNFNAISWAASCGQRSTPRLKVCGRQQLIRGTLHEE